MKKIKVTVIDSKTLEILEDATKGDQIDLNTIHDIDIDSSEIDKLISNVKDVEFSKRLENEKLLLEQKKEIEFKETLGKKEEELNNKIKTLELEKVKLESDIESLSKNTALTIEKEITNKEKQLLEQNTKTINELNEKIIKFQAELQVKEKEKEELLEKETLKNENNLNIKLSEKDIELLTLSGKIKELESEKINIKQELELKSKDNLTELKNKVKELENQIKLGEENNKLTIVNEKQKLELELNKKIEEKESLIKAKDTEIVLLKDLRVKQSTKMLGETLEQHFFLIWEQQGRFMFPNATFEKDNDVNEGTKGDFVYREFDDNGIEILSVMFEMKNESDTTATKHKNEDFFDKLDKDRKKKDCEYAVLASLLEKDNDLYADIYTVDPKKYNKMYAIRPQHFITLINLLRQGNITASKYKLELENIKKRDLDVTNFENNLNVFKDAFSKNYDTASKYFMNAIKDIDDTIIKLEKIKKELTTSENQLRLANDKSQDLTIKKLTNNAPSVRELFVNKEETSNSEM